MVGKANSASVGELVCARVPVSATQPVAETGDGERLLIDVAGNLANARNRPDRRGIAQRAHDTGLDFLGHEIAAVAIGADRQHLLLKAAQVLRFAPAHIVVEGALMLAHRAVAGNAAAPLRPGSLQQQLIDRALIFIERAIDAVELFGGHHVGGHAAFDVTQPLIVGLLERLESVEERVIGLADFGCGGPHGFVLPIVGVFGEQ